MQFLASTLKQFDESEIRDIRHEVESCLPYCRKLMNSEREVACKEGPGSPTWRTGMLLLALFHAVANLLGARVRLPCLL